MQDQVEFGWHTFGASTGSPAFDATIRFATALVQDGMSGVTVIAPRQPRVLTSARAAARLAGVSMVADNVGSATITMRFSSHQRSTARVGANRRSDRELVSGPGLRGRSGWTRVLGWLARARR